MHKIAFVVPTKDRPDDLRVMLRSVAAQTRKPDQLVVVDGSDPNIRSITEEYPELDIDYVRVFPPSLAEQRNAGMQRLLDEITLAGYLDDDLELEIDAIEKMVDFWEHTADDFGGAVFNITNTAVRRGNRFTRWFLLDSPQPGRLLRSGCVSMIGTQQTDIETDWLNGGATVWRRDVIENFAYDEWFQGTGYLEDVDYSFNVRNRYRLGLVASARVAHYSRPVRADAHYLLGKWQIVNRMYLVRKYQVRGLSVRQAWVANFSLVAMHLAWALLTLDRKSWNRARGNVHGIWLELSGKKEQISGHLK